MVHIGPIIPHVLMFRFYNGGSRERQLLWETYSRIVAHVNTIFKVSLFIPHELCNIKALIMFCPLGSAGLLVSGCPFLTRSRLTCSMRLARMTEDFVIKYFWSAAGYGLMSIPLLFGKKAETTRGINSTPDVASRTESKQQQSTADGQPLKCLRQIMCPIVGSYFHSLMPVVD